MVIVVATVLSFAAMNLQPLQQQNEKRAKKTDILKSIHMLENLDEVDNKSQFIENQYKQYITNSKVINAEGEEVEGTEAFDVDMKKEVAKPYDERKLPMYIAQLDNGEKKIIIPTRGKGLWGPVWGYISLNGDYQTIYGAVFDHKTETPGLGAEIANQEFQEQFQGKTLFNNEGEFVSINVYKGGQGAAENAGDLKHGVDGISGGTITSKGVEKMIEDCIRPYLTYFKQKSESL